LNNYINRSNWQKCKYLSAKIKRYRGFLAARSRETKGCGAITHPICPNLSAWLKGNQGVWG